MSKFLYKLSELQKAHRELLLNLESQLGANPETDKNIKAQIAAAEQAMIYEVDSMGRNNSSHQATESMLDRLIKERRERSKRTSRQ